MSYLNKLILLNTNIVRYLKTEIQLEIQLELKKLETIGQSRIVKKTIHVL